MNNLDQRVHLGTLIRNFLSELAVCGLLVVGYFFLVLRLLAEPLQTLFGGDLNYYAMVALILMVAQAVVLERITSFLVDRLELERLE